MSAMSICSIDFDMSSTENGMLHREQESRSCVSPRDKLYGRSSNMAV